MQMFDNVTQFVKDDLKNELASDSRASIASAFFSIYAYQELKNELESIDSLRFIFPSPTFTTEHAPKEKREFYIPRLSRETSLCGSDFELKVRNDLHGQYGNKSGTKVIPSSNEEDVLLRDNH